MEYHDIFFHLFPILSIHSEKNVSLPRLLSETGRYVRE